MTHEERHALGLWLVAALIGGFVLYAWWSERTASDRTPPPVPDLPVDSIEGLAGYDLWTTVHALPSTTSAAV